MAMTYRSHMDARETLLAVALRYVKRSAAPILVPYKSQAPGISERHKLLIITAPVVASSDPPFDLSSMFLMYTRIRSPD